VHARIVGLPHLLVRTLAEGEGQLAAESG
jgi:hypothetical protein